MSDRYRDRYQARREGREWLADAPDEHPGGPNIAVRGFVLLVAGGLLDLGSLVATEVAT